MTKTIKKEMEESSLIINEEKLRDNIYTIRGQKVMLDYELARIYGYTTKAFNQQVRNNSNRFDDDFMFQLTREEVNNFVRSKNLTSRNNSLFSGQSGGSRYLPNAFTEQGIYMLMTILKGELAIRQSKALIRTFRAMKDYILENGSLLKQREQLESLAVALENTRHITRIEDELSAVDQRLGTIENNIGEMVTKNDLSPLLLDFSKAVEQNEFVVLDRELLKASELYMKIYGSAKKSVYIIDNYVDIKTLGHLRNVKHGVEIVIFSDNPAGYLRKLDYDDFRKERSDLKIKFIKTGGLIHDRFIVIDYGAESEVVYHSGASEKDAGNKLMVISKYADGVVKGAIDGVVERIMKNERLRLK